MLFVTLGMKISIPTIPAYLLSRAPLPAIAQTVAVARVAEFLNERNTLVVTGAGVSVDSGIRVSQQNIFTIIFPFSEHESRHTEESLAIT